MSHPPANPQSDTYLEPYRKARDAHGSDFDVTLWANPGSQRKRFEVLTQMLDLRGKRILDAGCSRGDLATYLNEAGIRYKQFIGVDGLPELIEFAQSRRLPRSVFLTGDIVTQPELLGKSQPDVVVISGTLNTMDDDLALRVLEDAWSASGQTLAFNFLSDRVSTRATPQTSPARRLPTLRLLDWALSSTWNMRFRQDYFLHGHDATIVMTKPTRASD